ncbi:glycine zipper 2TM domain-containing protein [Sphingomonas flavalba]|uniref:glycine zipper 2TM domain-containing protein n=1 Tax=Sphingomonas flavalba TaxID=2559804 RepID=UPI0039E0D6CD
MLKMTLAATIAAMLLPIAPAAAQRHNGYHRGDYDRHGRYVNPRRLNNNDKVWRGRDGRYYCKRDNGTTGLIIGGAVGALLGRSLDGGRDKTLGTVLGAGGGALLGRSIDKGELRCR